MVVANKLMLVMNFAKAFSFFIFKVGLKGDSFF
jgi:hypothetical protein